MQRLIVVTAAMLSLPACSGHERGELVGLSLYITDGVPAPLVLVGPDRRFLDELDLVASVATATDEGIAPVTTSGDLAGLDWSGVTLADEEWRPEADGTFTRQRFYRGAAWMEQPSFFVLFQLDAAGAYLPAAPLAIYAGIDDLWTDLDGAFVRRFVARQVTRGCAAVGDCSTSTEHLAEALVQLRQAQHPGLDARRISPQAAALRLLWTAEPGRAREIPVRRLEREDVDHAYGFELELEVVTPPANGRYYVPGEAITFRMHLRDGDGNDLFEGGALPTYADFLDGGTDSGLRYFDLNLATTLYYALKHREGNLLVAMGGPADRLRVTDYTIPLADVLLPQAQTAFAAEHGFSAVVTGVPPLSVVFGGASSPPLWDTPVSNEVVLTVPLDAQPGTYVVATKARRDFAGEAINAGAVARIQVGTTDATAWIPTTGGCAACHEGPTALGDVLHGLGDRASCLAGCHVSIEIEPDAALDYRVHFIHTRSDRYAADPADCLVCHLAAPAGPARGYPGVVFPFE